MKAIFSVATAFIVLGMGGVALAGSATQEAMDEDVATNRALSKVPQGKKVTGTSCTSIEIGMGGETSYRCTATWEWRFHNPWWKRHFQVSEGLLLNRWSDFKMPFFSYSVCLWRLHVEAGCNLLRRMRSIGVIVQANKKPVLATGFMTGIWVVWHRSGGIWTHDPHYPKVVRYQAALRPVRRKLSQCIPRFVESCGTFQQAVC